MLLKPKPVFVVLRSFRTSPTEWAAPHELLRVPIKGSRQRPFDGTRGASWPGPDELQGPGKPSSDLEALFEDVDGSEAFVAEARTSSSPDWRLRGRCPSPKQVQKQA